MRIAIVKLSALGDIVHAMVVLQFIKKFNKEISIDWIVEESYKDLLESNPYINKVYLINIKHARKKKSFLALIKEFKKILKLPNYDLVIDMQGLIKSALISKLIPSKQTLGFDKFSSREGFSAFFYKKVFNYGYHKNVIERNVSLIDFALGLDVNKLEIINKEAFLFSSQEYLINGLSNKKKNILLIPGASHLSKCYPISNFAQITTLIDANFFIIWGNKNEKILAEKIKAISPSVNICDKLSIDSLISVISQMSLVIGPDTGPAHMAWALNIPSITLFGPTPGRRNAYITMKNKIIESNSKVNPYKIDKNDVSISNISAERVARLARQLMTKKNKY
jgi:heptosyltransferase I